MVIRVAGCPDRGPMVEEVVVMRVRRVQTLGKGLSVSSECLEMNIAWQSGLHVGFSASAHPHACSYIIRETLAERSLERASILRVAELHLQDYTQVLHSGSTCAVPSASAHQRHSRLQ